MANAFPDDIAKNAAAIAALQAANLARVTLTQSSPGSASTNVLANISGTTIRNANAITPNAFPANAYVKGHDGANTRFYGDGEVINAEWLPAGGRVGEPIWLGSNGEFSLSAPPAVEGNEEQIVGRIIGGGKALLRFEPSRRHGSR